MFLFIIICAQYTFHKCSISYGDTTGVQTMDNVLAFGCDNITLHNLTSSGFDVDHQYIPFFNINSLSENARLSVSLVDCDFSQSNNFANEGKMYTRRVYMSVVRTSMKGFVTTIDALRVTFRDCVINLTAISEEGNSIAGTEAVFINCVFIGKIVKEYNRIFDLRYDENGNYKRDRFTLSFVDCRFDFDDDWKTNTDGDETPSESYKQFIAIDIVKSGSVRINFTRCYSTKGYTSLNLIKAAGDENVARRIDVSGEDNGFAVNWSWVASKDQLYTVSGEWAQVVNSSDYSPETQQPDDDKTTGGGDNDIKDDGKDSKDEKAWLIVAVVFIAAFAIAVVAIIVIVVACRKKYDRSENEN